MARKDEGLTMELPGVPKRSGRPRKSNPMTPAQRSARYRAKKAQSVSVTSHGKSVAFGLAVHPDLAEALKAKYSDQQLADLIHGFLQSLISFGGRS